MIDKLVKIANYADNSGNFALANNVDNLLKQAGIFDAFRTLVDPSYGGLDQTSSYWKRMQRGLRKGRIDRKIGVIFSLSIQREQLDTEITKLAAPVAEYKKVVDNFYDKLIAKTVVPSNLKNEVRELRIALRSMEKLLASRRLVSLLKTREKVHMQMKTAVEQLKALSPESKDYLIKLLSAGGQQNQDILNQARSIPVEQSVPPEETKPLEVESVPPKPASPLSLREQLEKMGPQQPAQPAPTPAPKKKRPAKKDTMIDQPVTPVVAPQTNLERRMLEEQEASIPKPFGEKTSYVMDKLEKRSNRVRLLKSSIFIN